jgi:glutaminyl-tRNA synthetase
VADSNISPAGKESRHFIQQIIDEDLKSGRVSGDIITRFPPEPNGYPHIGHAKAIVLNFSLAKEYQGRCHLRFDDTNPETEDMEYVRAMKRDIRWLGYDWSEHEYYASDYFEQLYDLACELIRKGLAYVDSQTGDEIRATRGTVTEAGTNSPYRDRSVEENLDLFARMRAGEFEDGAHVLRAKIDMTSPNMLMRDPVLYRIKKASHYRRGDEWPIYPLYDFAHPLSDAIEGITHSLCTLEFDVHRPLYDWLVDHLFEAPRPHQYESARLNLDYTVMSKRKLLQLVKEGRVAGWDDPRMPTLSGMRRRGYTAASIRRFCDMIGVAKADNRVDVAQLEFAVRDDLNDKARRVMCVLDPLKVVLTNFPKDQVEHLEASYWPHDIPKEGVRDVPLTREIWIEREDFMENPPKKFHRLSPGEEVRLRYGYIIKCENVVKDADGNVTELHCAYDPETKSGSGSDRRVKGTIHWVSASEGVEVDVNLYDRLFKVPNVDQVEEGKTFLDHLNPDSLQRVKAVIEPSAANDEPETWYQFERQGFFYLDPVEFEGGRRVWNRTVGLRDSWGKQQAPEAAPARPKAAPKPQEPAAPVDPMAELSGDDRELAIELIALHGLSPEDAAFLATRDDERIFFKEAARKVSPVAVANWLIHELRPLLPEDGFEALAFPPTAFAELVAFHVENTLSSRQVKEVLAEMVATGKSAAAIVEEKGLRQISDEGALSAVADKVLAAHPDRVAAYRGGKTGLIGFFMGQVMQQTGGSANPQVVKALLEEKLG